MTTEEINKAIEEEAEKRYPYFDNSESRYNQTQSGNRFRFRKGAEFVLSLFEKSEHGEQNENERLNNSEKLYRWVKASERLPEGNQMHPVKGIFVHNMEGITEWHSVYIRLKYDSFKSLEWREEINPQSNPELKAEEKIQEQDSKQEINENL